MQAFIRGNARSWGPSRTRLPDVDGWRALSDRPGDWTSTYMQLAVRLLHTLSPVLHPWSGRAGAAPVELRKESLAKSSWSYFAEVLGNSGLAGVASCPGYDAVLLHACALLIFRICALTSVNRPPSQMCLECRPKHQAAGGGASESHRPVRWYEKKQK